MVANPPSANFPADTSARYVVVGPDRHGVVAHALRLAKADPRLRRALVRWPSPAGTCPSALLAVAVPHGSVCLMHVTDRLFGSCPEESAAALRDLGSRSALALVLHDIPQPEEGQDWYARRRLAYAAIASAATTLVLSSAHERSALTRCFDDPAVAAQVDRVVRVVPLPVEPATDGTGAAGFAPQDPAEVAVLGFLYPGKGVEAVIDAAVARLSREVRVTCLGAPAEGHAEYAAQLDRRARSAGVSLRITGYLDEAQLTARLQTVDVPVVAHRHISASGSLNTWLAAGRRPVTVRSRYTEELAHRAPGAVALCDDLQVGVGQALDHPGRTWLDPAVRLGPSWAEAARAHADVLAQTCLLSAAGVSS